MTRATILRITIFTVLTNSINSQFGYQQYGNQQRHHSRANPQQHNQNFGFNQPQNLFNQQDFVFPNYQQNFYPQNQNHNHNNHMNHHHHHHHHQNNFDQQPQIPVKPVTAATQKVTTTSRPFTQPAQSNPNRIDERISQASKQIFSDLSMEFILISAC